MSPFGEMVLMSHIPNENILWGYNICWVFFFQLQNYNQVLLLYGIFYMLRAKKKNICN